MKKNKKLFLASIAAMGAVAIGTGAVSTFAWYQAQAAGLSANKTGDTTIQSTTQQAMDGQPVNISISATDTDLGLSYWNGESMLKKAVSGNGLIDDVTTANFYQAATITAEWALPAPSTAEKALLDEASVSVTISPQGNIQLLSSAARTNHDNEVDSIAVTVKWDNDTSKFIFTATGLTDNGDSTGTFYFAVKPNNLTATEYSGTASDYTQVPTAYSNKSAYSVGTSYVSYDSKAWVCKTAISDPGEGTHAWNAEEWTRIDHGFDGILLS